ncbi:DUF2508 family protein [Papillibacter cinnamivorans]|uniref:DUF2508 domain-containing protein n=1 Tax=Papillibacter cinnamivorans DSM 12816 TaxID=1122930 RepID=A0A1W2BH34_9FIRM|nr:DUF2508 family protein [Papillibacter cinnamivorans]SMC72204.1 Protein of unknown function [Papillibacter cinnamivorans DSM 12816]
MSDTAKVFPFRKRQETEEETERRELLLSLKDTQRLIRQAYLEFNTAKDPELIEACVYEINSLQARYAYLLRRIKECGGAAPELLGSWGRPREED